MTILTLSRSTRYDAETILVEHGVKCRPRWTVMPEYKRGQITTDNLRAMKRSSDILRNISESIPGHRIHLRSEMSTIIEAITFKKKSDAEHFIVLAKMSL